MPDSRTAAPRLDRWVVPPIAGTTGVDPQVDPGADRPQRNAVWTIA